MVDNLAGLKDDMTAFIEGHGMKRFSGYVSDDVQSVTWEAGEIPTLGRITWSWPRRQAPLFSP